MEEFVNQCAQYLNANNKSSIQKWENYVNRLIDSVEPSNPEIHIGFHICNNILQQLNINNNFNIYFVAANTIKTICSKKQLSGSYLDQVIALINNLQVHHRLPSSNPIILQLTLGCSALFMHNLYYRLSQQSMSNSVETITSQLVTEIQNFFNISLQSIQNPMMKLLLIQRLSEYLDMKEMKFWISVPSNHSSVKTASFSSSSSSVKSSTGSQAKLKIDLIYKIQLSLLNCASIILPILIPCIHHQLIGMDNESLSFSEVFLVANDWFKNLVEMDVWKDPNNGGGSANAAVNSKKGLVSAPTPLLSTEVMMKLIEFWLKNPFLQYAWDCGRMYLQLKKKKVNSVDVDIDEDEEERIRLRFEQGLDFILFATELSFQTLEYCNFKAPVQNNNTTIIKEQHIATISQNYSEIFIGFNHYLETFLQEFGNVSEEVDIADLLDGIQPLIRMQSTLVVHLFDVIESLFQYLQKFLPNNQAILQFLQLPIMQFVANLERLMQYSNFIFQIILRNNNLQLLEVLYELIGYTMEIWLEIMKINGKQTEVNFRNQVNRSFNTSLEIMIHFSNFVSILSCTSNSAKVYEEINQYRASLRDFLRDITHKSLFQDLVVLITHQANEYVTSTATASEPADGFSTVLAHKGYWLESLLHALSSTCKDKFISKLLSQEEVTQLQAVIIPLWKALIQPVFISHRLICRMNVMLLSEMMKFFLDSQEFLAEETGNEISSLFLQSYSVIYQSLQHKEAYESSASVPLQLQFDQSVPFRLKQDHIGAVAFQKSLDYLLQLATSSGENKTKIQLSVLNRIETIILHALYPKVSSTFADLLNAIIPRVFHQSEILSHHSQSLLLLSNSSHNYQELLKHDRVPIIERSMFTEILALTVIYLVHHSSDLNSLPLQSPSFSIFFHSVALFTACPINILTGAALNLHWVLLAPAMLALSRKQQKINQINFELFQQRFVQFLFTSPNQSDDAKAQLNYFICLFIERCTKQVLLSVISEQIQAMTNNLQQILRKEGFLQTANTAALWDSYVSTVFYLVSWLSLMIIPLNGTSSEQREDGDELFDEIFERLSTLLEVLFRQSMDWISVDHQLNSETIQLIQQKNQELFELCQSTFFPQFVFFLTSYFQNEIYFKRSIQSTFRLLITMRNMMIQSFGITSPQTFTLQTMTQTLFNEFSKLGIAAVQYDQQSKQQRLAEIRRKEINQIQNVFAISVERESKRTVQQTKYLQQAYHYNLYVLLKFWILSFDSLVPGTVIHLGNDRMSSSDDVNDQLWQAMDKSMLISVIGIICNSMILSSTVTTISIESPSNRSNGSNGSTGSGQMILSEEIWRLMIQLLHISLGILQKPINSNNTFSSTSSNHQKSKQAECYCVELIDSKVVSTETGSILNLHYGAYAKWLLDSNLRNQIMTTIFHSILLSSSPFTAASAPSAFQPTLPASQREQAVSILEHLYLMYGANECTNVLLQLIPPFLSNYYSPLLQSKEQHLTGDLLTIRAATLQEQLTLSVTQLFSSATIGDWKRFKNILKLLCR